MISADTRVYNMSKRRRQDDDYEGPGIPIQRLPPADVLERMSLDLVRYALSCEEGRNTIRREFIIKEIIAPSSHRIRESSIFPIVLEKAQRILRARFGMEIVPLPGRLVPDELRGLGKKKDTEVRSSIVQAYILRNILPDELKTVISGLVGSHEKAYMGLVFVIVSIIASRGGFVTRSTLEVEYLPRFNLLETVVGNPASFLSKMIKQQYIVQMNVQEENREPRPYLLLGPRARVEFPGEELITVIATISGPDFNEASLKNALERASLMGELGEPPTMPTTGAATPVQITIYESKVQDDHVNNLLQ